MISYKRLPGSSGLGTLGLPDYKAYWNIIKQNIADFKNLGYQISLHQQHLGIVKSILVNRNDKNQNIMDDDIAKTQDDLDKYWRIQGYIDNYLPQWAQLDNPATVVTPGSGVSFVPLILGLAAIAALAYCVTVGMSLIEEYKYKTNLTTAVIEQKITAGQAAEVLSVPRSTGSAITEEITSVAERGIIAVGSGIGFGIPTAVLVAGGLYLAYTTGMLNSVMGLLKGLGGSSTSSST